jgi:hypothetical protein
MVFAFHLVLVDVAEVVFGQFESNSKKGVEWVQYLRVEQPGEVLDFFNVVLNELRVVVLEVPVELRDVVYLYAIPDARLLVKNATTSGYVAIELALI